MAHGTFVLLAEPVRDAAGAPQPTSGCIRFDRYRPHGTIGHRKGGYVSWSGEANHPFANFSQVGVEASYAVAFHAVPAAWRASTSGYAGEPLPPPLPPDAVIARRTLRRLACATPLLCHELAADGARPVPG